MRFIPVPKVTNGNLDMLMWFRKMTASIVLPSEAGVLLEPDQT